MEFIDWETCTLYSYYNNYPEYTASARRKFSASLLLAPIAVIAALYVYYQNDNNDYGNLYLLPLAYGTFYFVFSKVRFYSGKYVGTWIFNSIMFVRYVILPTVIVSSRNYSGFGMDPSSTSVHVAVWLMIYEMAFAFLVIEFFGGFFYKRASPAIGVRKLQSFDSGIVVITMIVAGLAGVLAFRNVLDTFHFFLTTKNYATIVSLGIGHSGVIFIVVEVARMTTPLVVISVLYNRYRYKPKGKYAWWALVASIPNLTVIENTSRFGLVITAVPTILLMWRLFGKHRIKVTVVSVITLASAFLTITLYKMFSASFGDHNSVSVTSGGLAHTLDVYFAGPRNLALAVETKQFFPSGFPLRTFLADFSSSVMLLDRSIDPHLLTSNWFNYLIWNVQGASDQIIPMVGQGFIYFGFWGAPILTGCFILCMMWFERLAISEIRLEFYYLYMYMTIWMASLMMVNMSILVFHVTNMFLPLWITFSLNRKFRLHGKIK